MAKDSKRDVMKAKAAYLKGNPHRLKLERQTNMNKAANKKGGRK